MDVLFLHGNYPGQFPQLAAGMARQSGNRVIFLTNRKDPEAYPLEGVEVRRFDRHRETSSGIHPYLSSSEKAVLDGQGVIRALAGLQSEGFRPRLLIGHGGNGLLLFLRQLLQGGCSAFLGSQHQKIRQIFSHGVVQECRTTSVGCQHKTGSRRHHAQAPAG